MKLKIYSDGGARGNPGPAGIGVVIYNERGEICEKLKKYIGETTNNQAEYQALILGLEKAHELGATEVNCHLDSELVVKQVNRQYKVKDVNLSKQYLRVWNLINKFERATFRHVPRSQNALADELVNESLDAV
jgi:ribonuclease HI